MLHQAVQTSLFLIALSIISKMVSQKNECTAAAGELLKLAIHTKKIAMQDSDPKVRLLHAVQAKTYLDASRIVLSDIDLERHSGVCIQRKVSEFESFLSETRQSLFKPTKKTAS